MLDSDGGNCFCGQARPNNPSESVSPDELRRLCAFKLHFNRIASSALDDVVQSKIVSSSIQPNQSLKSHQDVTLNWENSPCSVPLVLELALYTIFMVFQTCSTSVRQHLMDVR
jgi:hypothetical protein